MKEVYTIALNRLHTSTLQSISVNLKSGTFEMQYNKTFIKRHFRVSQHVAIKTAEKVRL